MKSQKLVRMLEIITDILREKKIPFSLIGALALGVYGSPRFTADIDILSEDTCCDIIPPVMEDLGYTCFNRGKSFAQFDSELGAFGGVDFLFVSTAEGKSIIKRSILIKDELFGSCPVVQPVDYIGLKLMDIANNPVRASRDIGDIIDLLQILEKGLLPPEFELPDREKIYYYADRFGQREEMDAVFDKLDNKSNRKEVIEL